MGEQYCYLKEKTNAEKGNEKDYRPITYLSTSYNMDSGIFGKSMKSHAGRNNIWDRIQIGACEGKLGTVDQLLLDSSVINEVREHTRNLVEAFYDYQNAYDMGSHDWVEKVFKWIRVPEKV